MDLRQLFATNLRRIRHHRGISQEELAHLAAIDRAHVSKVERGVLPPPDDQKILQKWAAQLGLKEGTQEWQTFFELARGQQRARPEKRLVSEGGASALVLPPPTTRPEKLPLADSNISWVQFEAFARDFISQMDGLKKVRAMRKDRARMLTILREREIAAAEKK